MKDWIAENSNQIIAGIIILAIWALVSWSAKKTHFWFRESYNRYKNRKENKQIARSLIEYLVVKNHPAALRISYGINRDVLNMILSGCEMISIGIILSGIFTGTYFLSVFSILAYSMFKEARNFTRPERSDLVTPEEITNILIDISKESGELDKKTVSDLKKKVSNRK
ncbi:MAG: hypothetical protein NTX52_06825 [Planctomycetota bacterium]|nr:hypothetical protein [Planctomycetota bacterium]